MSNKGSHIPQQSVHLTPFSQSYSKTVKKRNCHLHSAGGQVPIGQHCPNSSDATCQYRADRCDVIGLLHRLQATLLGSAADGCEVTAVQFISMIWLRCTEWNNISLGVVQNVLSTRRTRWVALSKCFPIMR